MRTEDGSTQTWHPRSRAEDVATAAQEQQQQQDLEPGTLPEFIFYAVVSSSALLVSA